MEEICWNLKEFYKNHVDTIKVVQKGRKLMCKCKKVIDGAAAIGNSRSGSNVAVAINVTDIVKYVAIAGVAIVGIIFGTKTWCNYMKNKEDEEA
jgi:hypothetical protein